MKINKAQTLFFLVCLCLTLSLVLFSTRNGPGFLSDSLRYVRAGESFARGEGFTEPFLNGMRREATRPFTHYPPFFPFLISVFIWLGIGPLTAVKIIPILSFCLTLLAIFMLARKVSGSYLVADIACLIACVFWPFIAIASSALSEATYMLLSVCAVLFLFNFYYEKSGYLKWLALSAAFTACTVLTRYMGIALFFTACVAIFTKQHDPEKGRFKKLPSFILFSAISLLPLTTWFIRNWLSARALLDWQLTIPKYKTFLFRANLSIGAVSQFFKGIFAPDIASDNGFSAFYPAAVGIAAFFIIASAVYVLARYRKQYFPKIKILFFYILFYLLLYAIASSATPRPIRQAQRYFDIICPFLIIAVVYLVYLVIGSIKDLKLKKFAKITAILLLAAFLLLQFQQSLVIATDLKGFDTPFWKDNRGITWVKDNLAKDDILYSNYLESINYKLGRLAIYIPFSDDPGYINSWFMQTSPKDRKIYVLVFKQEGNKLCLPLEGIETLNRHFKSLEKLVEFHDSVIYVFIN